MSPNTLWDAAKGIIRGKIIALTASRKKEKQTRLTELQDELKTLKIRHTEQKDPQILTRIKTIKQYINRIYDEEIEKQLKFTKQKYYETGPRAMKLLSWRIRKQQEKNKIYKIRNPKTQNVCGKPEDIECAFELHYKGLYTQPTMVEKTKIETFLSSPDLPSIGKQQNKDIMAEITAEELNKAFSRLKANKAPGSDRYLSEWYKSFKPQIIPVLLNCLNHTLRTGEAPQSWKEAVISIIPKEGKNKKECSLYKRLRDWNPLSQSWWIWIKQASY